MKFLKGLGNFVAFLLSIVFFAILLVFVLISFAKNLVTEETLYNYIEETSVYELPADKILSNTEKNIREVLYTELNKYGTSEELVNKIIDEKRVEKVVASYSSKYINYILFDGTKPIIYSKDFYKIISISEIEGYVNRILTNKEKDEFNKFVTDTLSAVNNSIPSRSQIIKNDTRFNEIVDFIYSDTFDKLVIISLVALTLFIAVFTWSLYEVFDYIGTSVITAGLTLVVMYITEKIGIRYIIKNSGTIEYFVKNFTGVIMKHILIYGLVIMAIGIVMVIIHRIIKRVVMKRKDKKVEVIEDTKKEETVEIEEQEEIKKEVTIPEEPKIEEEKEVEKTEEDVEII